MMNQTNGIRGLWTHVALGLAIVAIVLTPACSRQSEFRAVEIRKQRYVFPSDEGEALIADQGHLYVRLRPRNAPFKLSFNTRSDRKQQETGKLVIAGISDQFGQFEYIQSVVGPIVCKQTPYWSCGFELMDGNVRWSVVFNRDHIREAESLKKEALRALRGYRAP